MSVERIIGVDFGNSTSVIRVKRYRDGKPVGDRLETKPVTFGGGRTIVPTLIQKLPTGDLYFGYDAEIPHGRMETKIFQNFKVDIENPDEGIRRQARKLTAEYFSYLAKSYRAQSEGGHLGENGDKERTIVSYPVKWGDEARAFLVRVAKDAGFPNVEGVNEAQTAILAATVQNTDFLTHKGYFRDGVPVNILLVDMGAGTTDLALCRHTPGAQPKTDILSTWPRGGNVLFGGSEMDRLLRDYVFRAMPGNAADIVWNRIGIGEYKAWKEKTVSPALERGQSVNYFSVLDTLLDVMGIKAGYSINRAGLEDFAADYLRQFPELVKGCVGAAGLNGDGIDLVILTGGHSRWYFVRDILSGKLSRFGEAGLGKIQTDPDRIIPITLPQETVALGLVYGQLWEDDPYSWIQPVVAAGDNECGQCDVSKWRDIVSIAAGVCHTVGLKKDGTVIAAGRNEYGQCDVSKWRDIVSIAAGEAHTVGLKKDGTVIAAGDNEYGQCDVSEWRDIAAIAAGGHYTVGLKKDRRVIIAGPLIRKTEWLWKGSWDKLVAYRYGEWLWKGSWDKLVACCRYLETVLGAHCTSLGRVMSAICFIAEWDDIVSIAAGRSHIVGLKKDGTVVCVECGDHYHYHYQWQDIVSIAVGDHYTVGLKKDGTVVGAGSSLCNVVAQWRDIVSIAAGWSHIVGLKKDGTVIVAGDFFIWDKLYDVIEWRDIMAIAAGGMHIVGLKKDGRLLRME